MACIGGWLKSWDWLIILIIYLCKSIEQHAFDSLQIKETFQLFRLLVLSGFLMMKKVKLKTIEVSILLCKHCIQAFKR